MSETMKINKCSLDVLRRFVSEKEIFNSFMDPAVSIRRILMNERGRDGLLSM